MPLASAPLPGLVAVRGCGCCCGLLRLGAGRDVDWLLPVAAAAERRGRADMVVRGKILFNKNQYLIL
jgi:hypothetical protein